MSRHPNNIDWHKPVMFETGQFARVKYIAPRWDADVEWWDSSSNEWEVARFEANGESKDDKLPRVVNQPKLDTSKPMFFLDTNTRAIRVIDGTLGKGAFKVMDKDADRSWIVHKGQVQGLPPRVLGNQPLLPEVPEGFGPWIEFSEEEHGHEPPEHCQGFQVGIYCRCGTYHRPSGANKWSWHHSKGSPHEGDILYYTLPDGHPIYDDKKAAVVTDRGEQDMALYEPMPQDTPKMQLSGYGRWIKHDGIDQPRMTADGQVAVILRGGTSYATGAENLDWVANDDPGDITFFAMPEGHDVYAVCTNEDDYHASQAQAELEAHPLFGEWG